MFLSSCSLSNFDEKMMKAEIKLNTASLQEIYFEIKKYLNEETSGLAEGIFPGCSDIIESVFGKYKNFSAKSPMKEIGKSILTIPVFTSEITPEIIKTAMEETTTKDVDEWLKKNIGKSLLSKRREFFKSGKAKNCMKKLFENLKKVASF